MIALAIAVTTECDGCIAAHARGAARQGATAQEVAEALGVAIAMNGGPGTVWAPRAYAAFREFAGESSGWCGRVRKRTAAGLTGLGGIIHCARLRASQQVVQAGLDLGGNGLRELVGVHLDEDPPVRR